MKRVFGCFLALAWWACLASPAAGQTTPSHLTGVVRDSQGGVLPGVTVTATSPALIGSQVVVSEANGSYRFPDLPNGTYTLKFELAGFQSFTRQNIVLAIGQTLTVDAQLQVATVQENVTVTAASPVVDTQTTAVGNTLDTQKLIAVPSSTDLWGALAQSPGVRMQGFDVGGSHKYQQTGYNAFGISGQTRVVIEGVDTTEGTGGAGGYYDYFAQNEVAVTAAGQDVAMNTPGAAVTSTIKSGGKDFHALVNQTYEPSSFVGDNSNPQTEARGGTAEKNLKFWENHDDLGGPIVKDRLWFYGAYNHFTIDQILPGVQQSVATNLGQFNNVTTKETWKPSSNDTLIGYYQWGKKALPLRGLSSLRGPASTLAQFSPGWMYNGKWDRVWSNRLFSEVNVGEFGYDFPERPSVDFKTNPPRSDLVTGVDHGAGFLQGGNTGPFESERAKPQVYGNMTYFLPTQNSGSHDLKFGFEWLNDMSNFASIGTSGPILYLDRSGVPSEIRLTDLGEPGKLGNTWTIPGDDNKRIALYAQDRWTMNGHVTLTAGVRYDRQAPYYTEGKRDPILTEVFKSAQFPQTTLFTRNNVAPRIGVAIDPRGDGKTAIKAFYGRYYFNFADSFSAVDPGGASYKDFVFNDLNGNGLYDGPQELGALLRAGGGVSTTLEPNIKTPHTDEIDVSVQRQFWGESAARLAYVRKMIRDQFATVNVDRLGQYTVPYTFTTNIQNKDTGVIGQQTFGVFDIPTSLKGHVDNVIQTMPADTDYGAENFNSVEVAFNKRFRQGLFVDSSFDWTRGDILASPNANRVSTSNTVQGDPLSTIYTGATIFLNPYPTVPYRQTMSSWVWHLSSRYELPYQIGIGANFSYQSGWNYARIISVNLPNAGTSRFWTEPIQNNRSDNVPFLNFRLDKGFDIPGGHKVTAMFDLFNITNSVPITLFNLVNGATYDQVITMLSPRTAEVGIRFEF